jgi:2'-5' RNA ligase
MPTHFSPSPRTLAIADRDHEEWRRGRERYGVWLIDGNVEAVWERVTRARQRLDGFLATSRRQPHVTLFVCGFISDRARFDDDFTPAMLTAQRLALHHAAVAPFRLTVGGLDSFDSAAFLEIGDPEGRLAALRVALAEGRAEIRQSAYTPHLTVGTYCGAFDKAEVAERLDGFAERGPILLDVRSIHFASYAAREIGGPLEFVECHALTPP